MTKLSKKHLLWIRLSVNLQAVKLNVREAIFTENKLFWLENVPIVLLLSKRQRHAKTCNRYHILFVYKYIYYKLFPFADTGY